jgi:hypothetical protein
MHSFASVLMYFHCVLTAESCTFGTFHMYTKIHKNHIFYMKCTVLLVFSFVFTVFSMCFHCRNMSFWYISHVYQNTHVPYILHEMHSFVSVVICGYCVFTAETCTFNTFHMYTKIQMYHILYMKCTVLQVFSFVFNVFSLQKHVLLIHLTCLQKYTCTIYYKWNA